MIKRLAFLALLACSTANAQFVPGQILTAQQLNNAFANVLPITGGTLTGPLTVPSLSVTGIVNLADVNITGGTISGLTTPLPVASGGTASSTASGSALDHITGFGGTGFLTRTGAGTYAFQSTTNGITYSNLAQAASNTLLGNSTGSTANVSAITVTGCNGAAQALQWTSGSGFGCNSSIATSGANSNITSLTGLTSPLSVGQGGTGAATSTGTGSVALSASPTFTGTPAAPTASTATNTTQLATTAFVQNVVGTSISASPKSRVIVTNTSAQSIPNNAATVVTGWTSVLNTGSNFVTATGVYTAPAAGQYRVTAQLQYGSATWASGTFLALQINQNGTGKYLNTNLWGAAQATGQYYTAPVSVILNCAANDTISISAFHTQGAAVTIGNSALSNFLMIEQLP